MPEIGEAARVRAVEAPVANFKQGVKLWTPGDEAEVIWSGFWQGQLERGAIALLEADGPLEGGGDGLVLDGVPGQGEADAGGVGADGGVGAGDGEAAVQAQVAGPAPEGTDGQEEKPAVTAEGVAPFWVRWWNRGSDILEETKGDGRDG